MSKTVITKKAARGYGHGAMSAVMVATMALGAAGAFGVVSGIVSGGRDVPAAVAIPDARAEKPAEKEQPNTESNPETLPDHVSGQTTEPAQCGECGVKEDEVYIVQRGDWLSTISAQYGVSVDQLAEFNGIKNPNLIYTGSALRVPYSEIPQG